jgi:hypothetical protein
MSRLPFESRPHARFRSASLSRALDINRCEAARNEMPENKTEGGRAPGGRQGSPKPNGDKKLRGWAAPSTPNVIVAEQAPESAVTRNHVGNRLANS